MKPIQKLSNVERAKLLFELFPGEIALFVDFVRDFTQSIIDNPTKLKSQAIDQLQTTEFWQELVHNAKVRLDQYGSELTKRSSLFSDQLFDGYDSLYGGYCLHQFIVKKECSTKFRYAVMLLFF